MSRILPRSILDRIMATSLGRCAKDKHVNASRVRSKMTATSPSKTYAPRRAFPCFDRPMASESVSVSAWPFKIGGTMIKGGNWSNYDYYHRSSGFCLATCGGDPVHDHRPSIAGRTSVTWLETGDACRQGPGIVDRTQTSRIRERAARLRIDPRPGASRPGGQWHRLHVHGERRRRDDHARFKCIGRHSILMTIQTTPTPLNHSASPTRSLFHGGVIMLAPNRTTMMLVHFLPNRRYRFSVWGDE